MLSADPDSEAALERWGYRNAWDIWDGDWWALFTSVFQHGDFMHIAFNLYWLWVIGRVVERTIGSVYYLIFFVGAAVISSAYEMAVTGEPGIGLSGVGYALFGFAWIARARLPALRSAVNKEIVGLFLFWLVLCMLGTWSGTMNIANTAHVTGLAFGALVGASLLRRRRGVARPAFVLFIALGIVPLFWAPWLPRWNGLQGERAVDRGDLDAAISSFSLAVALDPEYAWAFSQRGWARISLAEYDAAIEDFTHAIEADPNHHWALGGRGQALRLKQDYAAAVLDLTNAIASDSGYMFAYDERGWCHNAQGSSKAAIEDFTAAIRLDPNYHWAHGGRGHAHHVLGHYAQAEVDLTRAVELDPSYTWGYNERGWSRLENGRLQPAIADFTQAIAQDESYLSAYCGRGQALRKSGEFDGAIEDLRKAIELDLTDPFAHHELGFVLYRKGDWRGAKGSIERAIGHGDGENISAWFLKAMIHWRLGDRVVASNWFHQARVRVGDDAEMITLRDEAAMLLGESRK